jgi:sulfoquinovose isomerase
LSWPALESHRDWLAGETGRLLDFARGSRVEGGFGWLDENGRPDPGRPLQLLNTTRIHGLTALRQTFEDREHGGWFAALGGRTTKEAYLHVFVLLAASSATIAGRPEAGPLLDRATNVVERFWSEREGACIDSYDREWRSAEDYRGANANMHAVEAFLAARDATGDPRWSERALRIAERLIRDVAGAHDWLVPASGSLFARAVADGWQGGFVYTTDFDGRPVVTDRMHWVLTEAIGAAAALLAVTGDQRYDGSYRTFWDHADAVFRDHEHGSWRHELDERLQPAARTWAGKPDVYHAVQATLIPRLPVTASLAGALGAGMLR